MKNMVSKDLNLRRRRPIRANTANISKLYSTATWVLVRVGCSVLEILPVGDKCLPIRASACGSTPAVTGTPPTPKTKWVQILDLKRMFKFYFRAFMYGGN
jgi:hypothetical protein